jgi:RNA polymerase sigma-B factor
MPNSAQQPPPAVTSRATHEPRSRARSRTRAQEDHALFARYLRTRSTADRDVLVERFLPLARQIARRYQRPSETFDDLYQVASLGLLKAIDRFDPARGVAFSSFAVPTIAGELKRYYRDLTWSVRISRDLQELALRVDRAVSSFSVRHGRQPTIAEIAAAVGAADEDILDALQARGAHKAVSLDAPRGEADDGETLGAGLGGDDRGFAIAEDRATVEQLMHLLTPREREILRLRFQEDLTQSEIGERVGLSQMHVSRILRDTIARLRRLAPDLDRTARLAA